MTKVKCYVSVQVTHLLDINGMIFSLLFLDILQLFYSLHYTSFPFLKGCRLEKGHIVPVLYSQS